MLNRRSAAHAFVTFFATALALGLHVVLTLSSSKKSGGGAVVVAVLPLSTAASANAAEAGAVEGCWCDDDDDDGNSHKCDGSFCSARRDPNNIAASSRGGRQGEQDEDGGLLAAAAGPSLPKNGEDGDDEFAAPYEDGDDKLAAPNEATEGEDYEFGERDPSEWTFLEYWTLLDCDRHFQANPQPPIVDHATWFYLRGLYAGLVAAEAAAAASYLEPSNGGKDSSETTTTTTTTQLLERSGRDRRQQPRDATLRELAASQVSWNERMSTRVGFQVPVAVRHSEGRGRGVFAVEAIPEDSVVCIGGDEARFLDAQLFRAFVEAVPAELQCDILQFSYFDEEVIDGAERDVILVALNDEAFLNADWTEDGREANLVGIEYDVYENDSRGDEAEEEKATRTGDGALRAIEGRRIEYVARRDIAPGEELLLKYSNFLYDDGWEVFGL